MGDALQELEGLLSLQEQGTSAAANTARLAAARNQPEYPTTDEEANFALPEALATAVGAGWLLGPVGGLLLGAAQGILGKREKQAALDKFAAETEVLRKTDQVFDDELHRNAAAAVSEEELAILSALQTKKDAALQMMADDDLKDEGAALLAEFTTDLSDYTKQKKQEAIDANVEAKRAARELTASQLVQYNSMIPRFETQSAPFLAIMQSTDKALKHLADGSPASLLAATNAVAKTLDPDSMVKETEADRINSVGDLHNRVETMVEALRSGKAMSPKLRRDYMQLMFDIRESEIRFQNALQARFLDEADDVGLPGRYRNNFDLTGTIPAAAPGNFNEHTLPSEDVDTVLHEMLDTGKKHLEGAVKWGMFERFKNWAGGFDRRVNPERQR